MKKSTLTVIIFIVILLAVVELNLRFKPAPDNILIRLLKEDGSLELNASCNADVITKNNKFDKNLTELKSLYDYVDENKVAVPEDKGYYVLETGLNGYRGEFNIEVTCISWDKKRESFEVFNKTHLPCEVKEEGFIVC